jgi:membrane protein DedA with SNARE-associated domain
MDVALFAGAGISAAGATTLWTATWLLCAAALLGQVLRMLLRRRSGRCAIRQQAGWLQRENPARREGGRG